MDNSPLLLLGAGILPPPLGQEPLGFYPMLFWISRTTRRSATRRP